MINNAGIMRCEDLTRSRDLGDAEEAVVTNLLGPIRVTNALIDHLAAQPDAAIVNVSSGLAFVPLSATSPYSATKAAIHSYTVSLRTQLKDKVNVIELVPPGVQTELTPGQSIRNGYMPLDEFADEVMALFQRQPTPEEILVERVGFLRWAERDGRFDQVVELHHRSLSGDVVRHQRRTETRINSPSTMVGAAATRRMAQTACHLAYFALGILDPNGHRAR